MTTELPAHDDQANRETPTRRSVIGAFAVLPAAGALRRQGDQLVGGMPGRSLAALHRIWAPLAAEVSRLDCDISDVELAAGQDCIRRKGKMLRSDAEIDEVIDTEIDALLTPEQTLKILRVVRGDAEVDELIADDIRQEPSRRQALKAERQQLKIQLAERQAASEGAWERLGGPQMETERDQAAAARAAIVAEIHAAPIRDLADIAAMLDVAMGENEIDATMASEPDGSPLMRRLLRALVRQVPGFEFASLRVDLLPERYDRLFAEDA